MIDKNNSSFCILPFIHLATRPIGKLKTCCNASEHNISNLNNTDLESGWNSDYMKDIRLKMLKGEKTPNCNRCYREEGVGYRSKRLTENDHWKGLIDKKVSEVRPDGSMPFNLVFLDLRYGTKCNLKCVICDPENSSLWMKDYKKIYPKMKNKELKKYYKLFSRPFNDQWYQRPIIKTQISSLLKDLRYLYFAGGEPLIIDEHYKTLEECVSRGYAKNIDLSYNSNGTRLRNDLFGLWKEFKSVQFRFSVDDLFERNDYIRFPSKWKKTEETFDILDQKSPDNVTIEITCAVSILNIYYLPELINWVNLKKFKKIKDPLFHLVTWPPQLNPQIMSGAYKTKLGEKYDQFFSTISSDKHKYTADRMKSILRFTESEDYSDRLPRLKEYLSLLDEERGTSFEKVFPELKEIFLGL